MQEQLLPDKTLKQTGPYALIGDVHSQGAKLSKALAFCRERELTPIFLGDLFDSRCDTDETLYAYNLVRDAQRKGAIVLNSNHQERLKDVIDGIEEPGWWNEETFRSLEILERAQKCREVRDWLETLPDGFVFRDSSDREWRCAHAYFPSRLARPEWKMVSYFVYADSPQERETMTWGPYDGCNKRVYWWQDGPERSYVRAAGHYHICADLDDVVLLDANCGYEGGTLPVMVADTRELVHFD